MYFSDSMKDNFSKQADIYARYRPHYPVELFDFILAHVNNRQTAWDCGTGNGQSAKVLAGYFENVLATDISQKQIEHAEPAGNISYSVQPAEQRCPTPAQVGMVTAITTTSQHIPASGRYEPRDRTHPQKPHERASRHDPVYDRLHEAADLIDFAGATAASSSRGPLRSCPGTCSTS